MPTPSSTENHPTEKIPRAKKPTPKKIMVASRYAQQNTTTAPHVRKPSQLSSTRMVKKAPAAKNTIVAKPRQRVDSKPTKSTHVDHKEARRKPGIPAEKPIPKRVSNTTTTPVNQTDQLEMEIRANLYYQLCFCRAKTHTSFVALKAKAEAKIQAIWTEIQDKRKAMHLQRLDIHHQESAARQQAVMDILHEPMLALFRELDQMIQEVEALSNVLRSTLHRVPIQCSRKENHVQDTHELYQAMTSLQLKMKTVCTLLRSSGCASETTTLASQCIETENTLETMDLELAQLAREIKDLALVSETRTSRQIQDIQKLRQTNVTQASSLVP